MLKLPKPMSGFSAHGVFAIRELVNYLQEARHRGMTQIVVTAKASNPPSLVQMAAYAIGYHLLHDEDGRPTWLKARQQVIPSEAVVRVHGYAEVFKLLSVWYGLKDEDGEADSTWFTALVGGQETIEVDVVLAKIVEVSGWSEKEFVRNRNQLQRTLRPLDWVYRVLTFGRG